MGVSSVRNGFYKSLEPIREESLIGLEDLKKIWRALECPVTFRPLDNAVSIAPCMHKFQKSVVEKLFQKEGVEKQSVVCPSPFCNRVARAYYEDPIVKSVVEYIHSSPDTEHIRPASRDFRDLESSKAIFFNLERFLEILRCPVAFEFLDDAVSLVPCMHKVQRSVVEKLSQKEGIKGLRCPVCEHKIEASYEDNIISELVRNVLSFSEQEKIVQKQAEVKEKNQQKTSFLVKFEHRKGNWEELNLDSDLVKQMNFICVSTLFTEFAILGFKNGKIRLYLSFKEENKKHVSNYFSQLGIQIKNSECFLMKRDKASDENTMYILRKGRKANKELFLAIKNAIPREYRFLIKSLVEVGDWREHLVNKSNPDYFI